LTLHADRFWVADSPWPWLFAVFGVLPAISWLAAIFFSTSKGEQTLSAFWYLPPVVYATVSFAVSWGISLFTGVVTDRKLNRMIGCCYIITGVALLVSILPFTDLRFFHEISSADAPLSAVRGCALASNTVAQAQAGGAQGQAGGAQGQAGGAQGQAGGAQGQAGGAQGQAGGARPPAANIPGEVLCSGDPNAASTAGDNVQWVLNLGGTATNNSAPYQLRGGVVVPLYVIVLALFGSAVSMTRRVPEYQQRAMDSQDPLTNVETRQKLVFQIMQVLSAPLIAITVYYIYKPATPAESVVIGFGSGFASEPILLMIRSLVEKLSPTQSTTPSAITVRVSPESASVAPGATKQFSAKVLGSQNQEVIWRNDPSDVGNVQSGLYSAPKQVQSEQTVTVIASSTADHTKSGSATVKLTTAPTTEPATITVHVDPPPSVELGPGGTKQFGAKVQGSPNSKVNWRIDPPDAAGGTISRETGLYSAPPGIPAEKTVTVVVTSDADPKQSDSATVKLTPHPP
jgi:hypothetical protein